MKEIISGSDNIIKIFDICLIKYGTPLNYIKGFDLNYDEDTYYGYSYGYYYSTLIDVAEIKEMVVNYLVQHITIHGSSPSVFEFNTSTNILSCAGVFDKLELSPGFKVVEITRDVISEHNCMLDRYRHLRTYLDDIDYIRKNDYQIIIDNYDKFVPIGFSIGLLSILFVLSIIKLYSVFVNNIEITDEIGMFIFTVLFFVFFISLCIYDRYEKTRLRKKGINTFLNVAYLKYLNGDNIKMYDSRGNCKYDVIFYHNHIAFINRFYNGRNDDKVVYDYKDYNTLVYNID